MSETPLQAWHKGVAHGERLAKAAQEAFQPQHQGPLNEQLRLLIPVATKMGLYDAADHLQRILENGD